MKPYRIERHTIDRTGERHCRVHDLAPASGPDYWFEVTHIPYPVCEQSAIPWAKTGQILGYPICNQCSGISSPPSGAGGRIWSSGPTVP